MDLQRNSDHWVRMRNESASAWALNEFCGGQFSDARWGRRAVAMAVQSARRPAGTVSAVFTNAAERQGAYGLLESPDVTAEQLSSPMFAAAARRCADHPFVFAAVDGSSLSLTDKAGEKNFGPIGTHTQGKRGLKVMSSLFISPQGVPLGLGSQAWWARTGQKARRKRWSRETKEKEIQRWLDVIEQTWGGLRENAPRTRGWFLLDREGDAWPILLAIDKAGDWFTIRGNHDRRVTLTRGRKGYLRTVVMRQPVSTTYELHVPPAPGRKERTAHMTIRACEVSLDLRDKRSGKHFTKVVNVVLARESRTTPHGEKPLEWLLLTNRPIRTTADLHLIVNAYGQRWCIEEFHRTWKSGVCGVEDTQLRDAAAVQKWATLLAAVAVRIERLKKLAREQPTLPATEEFTPVEIRVIALVRFGKQARKHLPKGTIPTIAEAVLWVAEIGGYTGKSSGGPPGSTTLARGLYDVQLIARTLAELGVNCD